MSEETADPPPPPIEEVPGPPPVNAEEALPGPPPVDDEKKQTMASPPQGRSNRRKTQLATKASVQALLEKQNPIPAFPLDFCVALPHKGYKVMWNEVLRMASVLDAEDDEAVKTLVARVKEAEAVQREHMRLEDEYLIKPLSAKTYYSAQSPAPSSTHLAIAVTPATPTAGGSDAHSAAIGAASLSLMARAVPPNQGAQSKRKIPQEDEHAEEKNLLTHILSEVETLANTTPRHNFQVKQFYGTISEFLFEYYQHLHGEEHGFVQSIEAHFSKVEQLELATAFVKNFDAAIMPDNLRYTLLGTNSDERFQFLSLLKRVRPTEEFQNLFVGVVKRTISDSAFETLATKLHIVLPHHHHT